MEELLIKIFTEWWIIYMLFTVIVGGFILKGIPYMVNRFEQIIKDFNITMKEQQTTFERSLNKISEDFLLKITKSEQSHERIINQLLENWKIIKEIKDIVSKK